MADPDEGATFDKLARAEERVDLSESFTHGAQMISNPPPVDAAIPQALIGTPPPQDNAATDE